MGNITEEQKIFFDSIKDACINAGNKANILPSIIGGIAALISNYGNSEFYKETNNLFSMTVDDSWFGTCYSVDSKITYENPKSCDEKNFILLKAFTSADECINHFVDFLTTARRSKDGPFKYSNIIGDTDYKNVINKLSRLGFNHEFTYTTTSYFFNTCVAIIENSGIYEWDNEVKDMSRKRIRSNRINTENTNDNEMIKEQSLEQEETVEEQISHMYRVRLAWEKPDTQIFASPDYEAAKTKALVHEGYKIYIDDDGELFEDPWMKKEEVKPVTIPTPVPGVKEVIHPYEGKIINLHDTPVYRNATDEMYFRCISGRFYFYDSTIVNGRAKITATQHMPKKNPSYILGYININE